MVSCTIGCVACKSVAMLGVAGRYMSIDSGPNADSAPRRISSASRRWDAHAPIAPGPG
jgi:hypothetical protein